MTDEYIVPDSKPKKQPENLLMSVRRYLNDADYYVRTQDCAQARVSAERAIDTAREQGDRPSIAAAYYGMAAVIWSCGGDPREAHQFATLAAEHTTPNTETDLMLRTLTARLKVAIGNFSAAVALNEDLLEFYEKTADLQGRADVLRSLGGVHAARQEYDRAYDRYLQSLSIYATLNDPLNHAGLLLSLGSLMYEMGRLQEARDYWTQARNISESNGYRHIVDAVNQALGLLR